MCRVAIAFIVLLCCAPARAQVTLPERYWQPALSGPLLEKTETIRLAPDLTVLSPGERQALNDLLSAGRIMQQIYEEQRHHQSQEALRNLESLHRKRGEQKATAALLDLYRLFSGPVATTLDNRREPFLPVEREVPGRNVYPWGVSREELEAWFATSPGARERLLDERTVVRRATKSSLAADLAVFDAYPALATLHAGVREEIERLSARPDSRALYALPYAVA